MIVSVMGRSGEFVPRNPNISGNPFRIPRKVPGEATLFPGEGGAVPFRFSVTFAWQTPLINSRSRRIIATMASKVMVNAAFKAPLLLRPLHRRTAFFGTVNKLECPIPGRPTSPPILSSRSYSASTFTPSFLKSSGSTESSQSSRPEGEDWFTPKDW